VEGGGGGTCDTPGGTRALLSTSTSWLSKHSTTAADTHPTFASGPTMSPNCSARSSVPAMHPTISTAGARCQRETGMCSTTGPLWSNCPPLQSEIILKRAIYPVQVSLCSKTELHCASHYVVEQIPGARGRRCKGAPAQSRAPCKAPVPAKGGQ
jgi:hypothetical protein